jgi:hypothetical protein
MRHSIIFTTLTLMLASSCAHHPVATVLPKGGGTYDVIGQDATEQDAYKNAESEARYTCAERDKDMIVVTQSSVYQGADKNKKDDVKGENVALAIFTGQSGKERNRDDYKVTITFRCD